MATTSLPFVCIWAPIATPPLVPIFEDINYTFDNINIGQCTGSKEGETLDKFIKVKFLKQKNKTVLINAISTSIEGIENQLSARIKIWSLDCFSTQQSPGNPIK